ncbi:hypothetical protein F5883DRAFT_623846 [Diaporthe sp. PMI_573]|nr:hypothetical protein F5883DRAFT_623846 [Diaporthaceae sp. PMI_573]
MDELDAGRETPGRCRSVHVGRALFAGTDLGCCVGLPILDCKGVVFGVRSPLTGDCSLWLGESCPRLQRRPAARALIRATSRNVQVIQPRGSASRALRGTFDSILTENIQFNRSGGVKMGRGGGAGAKRVSKLPPLAVETRSRRVNAPKAEDAHADAHDNGDGNRSSDSLTDAHNQENPAPDDSPDDSQDSSDSSLSLPELESTDDDSSRGVTADRIVVGSLG